MCRNLVYFLVSSHVVSYHLFSIILYLWCGMRFAMCFVSLAATTLPLECPNPLNDVPFGNVGCLYRRIFADMTEMFSKSVGVGMVGMAISHFRSDPACQAPVSMSAGMNLPPKFAMWAMVTMRRYRQTGRARTIVLSYKSLVQGSNPTQHQSDRRAPSVFDRALTTIHWLSGSEGVLVRTV